MLSSDYNVVRSTVIALNNFIQYSHCEVVQTFLLTPFLTKAFTTSLSKHIVYPCVRYSDEGSCLKFIKMRATLFLSLLVEMNFSLIANVKYTVEQTLLRNSHCLWACSESLHVQFKPTICTQSHPRNRTIRTTPLQKRHFPTPLCHAKNSRFTNTEQRYLCRVLHLNRQNAMLITDKPT